MKQHYDYLIVGAGPFGSVFAYEAGKRGKSCLVIDQRNHIGGNLYCQDIEGIPVHVYGPHIFHCADEDLWAYMQEFTDFFAYVNEPIALHKDKVYHLPFNMNTFNAFWGCKTPAEARAKIEEVRKQPEGREPQNLEEQALAIVGEEIYEALIKHYTEKQWGRACTDLPASIIKRLPLRFTWNNNYFNDPYQGMPSHGYMPLFEKWLEKADVQLNTDYLAQREALDALADRVVYTGMIDAFYGYCFGTLPYRSLRFEHEVKDELDFQGNAVVNYCDAEPSYTRIAEHKHFYGRSPEQLQKERGWNKTVITYEYSQEWSKGQEAYYPVNNPENQALFRRYKELALKEPKHLFGGRLADYAYYNMDQVILKALQTVRTEFGE